MDRELTEGKDNGKLSAVDQKRLTAVMRGLGTGELKHPRFTKEEAAASGEVVHERLWNYILSLESPEVYFGGGEEGSARDGADDPKSGGWLGCFRRMATRYGSDPRGLTQDRLQRPVHVPSLLSLLGGSEFWRLGENFKEDSRTPSLPISQ